jgi:maltose alpha-D-glucosyltransferase/alpha-amylase
VVRPEDFTRLEAWCRSWYRWVTAAFLQAYRERAGQSAFLPAAEAEFRLLVEVFLLSKAVYELGYELGHRPDWVSIPLMGILDIVRGGPAPAPAAPPADAGLVVQVQGPERG